MNWTADPLSMPLESTSLKALGQKRFMSDSNGLGRIEMLVYNGTGGAMVANACYILAHDGDEEFNPKAAVAGAVATVQRYVCVATEAAADAAYTWVVMQGYYSIRCDGTTDIAKDDFLKLAPGSDADALIKDGTAETISSVAIARAALTTDANANLDCFLLGKRCVVNT